MAWFLEHLGPFLGMKGQDVGSSLRSPPTPTLTWTGSLGPAELRAPEGRGRKKTPWVAQGHDWRSEPHVPPRRTNWQHCCSFVTWVRSWETSCCCCSQFSILSTSTSNSSAICWLAFAGEEWEEKVLLGSPGLRGPVLALPEASIHPQPQIPQGPQGSTGIPFLTQVFFPIHLY